MMTSQSRNSNFKLIIMSIADNVRVRQLHEGFVGALVKYPFVSSCVKCKGGYKATYTFSDGSTITEVLS